MRKIISLIAGVAALSGIAKADPIKAEKMTTEDSKKIAEALILLKDKEVLNKNRDGQFDLDKDIIKKLRDEGYLKKKNPQIQTICGGGGGGHS